MGDDGPTAGAGPTPGELRPRSVAIVIFGGVELLDFAGPFEVFSSVRTPPERRERLLRVFTVAETRAPVTCRNELRVLPDHTLDDCPPAEVLVVPGGRGVDEARARPRLLAWIAARSRAAELTTSVCTGSFLLAEAGLLGDAPVTTHWASIARLRREFPALDVREGVRWLEHGNLLTSAGVSAGIDMALAVTARLYGPEVARATARGIEYDAWPPPG